MIFPVKRVKEELINEFAVSKMDIETFSQIIMLLKGIDFFLCV